MQRKRTVRGSGIVAEGSTALRIRALTAADDALLREALYHAIHVPPGAAPPPRTSVDDPELARYVCQFGRPGDFGFAAELSAQIVGAVWARRFADDDRCHGFRDERTAALSIAVWPAFRGCGAGTALLQALLDASPGPLCLHVQKTNPAARLYRRLGFTVWDDDGEGWSMVWERDNLHR